LEEAVVVLWRLLWWLMSMVATESTELAFDKVLTKLRDAKPRPARTVRRQWGICCPQPAAPLLSVNFPHKMRSECFSLGNCNQFANGYVAALVNLIILCLLTNARMGTLYARPVDSASTGYA
jgi:hypothetical protein